MKTWIVIAVLGAALMASALTSCGGNDCDDLADICSRCMDESTKNACQNIASGDSSDACASGKDTYRMQCGG